MAGERQGGLYGLLELPWLYTLSQHLLAPGHRRLMSRATAEVFRASTGRVLDVGCGPAPLFPPPGDGSLVGVDVNVAYLAQYAGEGLDHSAVAASASRLPFEDGAFDEARCVGLLHHLAPEVARDTVQEMGRCVRTGGRVIVLDNVWPRVPALRPVAWLVRRLDRGAYIRHEQELTDLVESVLPGEWQAQRFTSAYNGLEGVVLVQVKG